MFQVFNLWLENKYIVIPQVMTNLKNQTKVVKSTMKGYYQIYHLLQIQIKSKMP